MKRSTKIRGLLFCLASTAAFAGSSALQAQDPRTGSRLGNRLEDGKAMKAADALTNAHKMARCIYQVRDRTVDRYLTTTDAADYADAGNLVFKNVECDFYAGAANNTDSIGVYSSESAMRGLLAEAGLRKRGFLTDSDKWLPALPVAEGYNKTWFAMTTRSNVVNAMSACFADTQPAVTVALLRTKPESAEEKEVIGEVASLLGPCLTNGAQLKANAFTLRAALAEAYFHRAIGKNEDVAPQAVSTPAQAEASL